jgi:hypothetical protein
LIKFIVALQFCTPSCCLTYLRWSNPCFRNTTTAVSVGGSLNHHDASGDNNMCTVITRYRGLLLVLYEGVVEEARHFVAAASRAIGILAGLLNSYSLIL